MSDELRERRPLLMRVLEAMQEADNYYVSPDQAQVAIALVRDAALEEAAKIADQRMLQPPTGNRVHDAGWGNACISIAAAIRALKERT